MINAGKIESTCDNISNSSTMEVDIYSFICITIVYNKILMITTLTTIIQCIQKHAA